jgi:Protein of unknown function (DUF3224)
MNGRARGPFEVTVTPAAPPQVAQGATLGRMSLLKTFHGDLEAQSAGEMLTAVTDVEGSAGYVAIERVTGRLDGRAGSFVLQHSGTMQGTDQRLRITVVPDSGTGALRGIHGTLAIEITEAGHSYDFLYELPDPPETTDPPGAPGIT